ncbi:MAG TPA: hypothetical protein PKW77_08690 [Verrucomicrobiota bacterium]|nr:hypothetical protein [Verrucomicrobiota bacterium]
MKKTRGPRRTLRPPFVLPWHCLSPDEAQGFCPIPPTENPYLGGMTARTLGKAVSQTRGCSIHETAPMAITWTLRRRPEDENAWPLPDDRFRLAALAQHAEPKTAFWAVVKLTRAVAEAIELLDMLSEQKPDLLRRVAREMTHWPVLLSPNPKRNADPLAILRKLDVSGALPTAEDAHSKAYVDDTAARTARALIDYLLFLRDKRRIPPLRVDALIREARALPALTKDTAADWWRVAEAVLLESYAQPLAVPELLAIVPPAHRRFPSRAKSSLLARLRERFRSIAKP